MKLRSGEAEHQTGDLQCTACDPGWPQQHSEAVENCCPGLIHAETPRAGDPAVQSKVIYYCDVCCEDDPF
jgi:hypothetical protein